MSRPVRGEEFEGSVWAHAPSFDAIFGKGNLHDSHSAVLQRGERGHRLGQFQPGTNQKETPIYDGRDPTMIRGRVGPVCSECDGAGGHRLRPAQPVLSSNCNNQGGAVWFDNASLERLTSSRPLKEPTSTATATSTAPTSWPGSASSAERPAATPTATARSMGPTLRFGQQQFGNARAASGCGSRAGGVAAGVGDGDDVGHRSPEIGLEMN